MKEALDLAEFEKLRLLFVAVLDEMDKVCEEHSHAKVQAQCQLKDVFVHVVRHKLKFYK